MNPWHRARALLALAWVMFFVAFALTVLNWALFFRFGSDSALALLLCIICTFFSALFYHKLTHD